MFDTELLRKLFEQRASQGAGGQQSPQIGAAGITPAQINPAQITPVNVGGGGATGGPDPNQKVWGRTMGEMFPQLFQGQQASAPRPIAPAAPMANPNAPEMPQAVQPRIAPQLQAMSESPQSFSPGVSTGAVDSPIKPTAPAPNYMPPITGINFPAENLPPISPDIQTSTNPGDIPGQLTPRIVPRVMVPQLPGRRGPAMEDNGINSARYEYATEKMGDDGKIHRNFGDVLKSAGRGFLQGAATNGLFGGFGGAVAGAVQGAADPAGARASNFDAFQRPGMERDQRERQMRAQQQLEQQKAQQEFEYKQAQTAKLYDDMGRDKNTVVTPGAAVIGPDGKVRFQNAARITPHNVQGTVDGKPGFYDANDPALKGKIQPYEKPNPNTSRPMNISAGGAVYDPALGVEVYRNPTTEKPDAHYAAGVEGALKQHSELKSNATAADAAYKVAADTLAKSKDKSADLQASVQSALARREAAMQALNAHALGVNQAYGDQLEGGVGDGGFGYVKRKPGGKVPAAGRANQSLVRNVNDLPKF